MWFSVVCTLVDNCKLANQIARLAAIVVKKDNHNIVSRAAQSNPAYVSVLKISIVHAKFFFAPAAIVSGGGGGGILYFATIMDTNRDSDHQSQNEDNFPTFSLGLEFLNEAEKEKNNGKGDSASAPS